jgi:hypothetical protein
VGKYYSKDGINDVKRRENIIIIQKDEEKKYVKLFLAEKNS